MPRLVELAHDAAQAGPGDEGLAGCRDGGGFARAQGGAIRLEPKRPPPALPAALLDGLAPGGADPFALVLTFKPGPRAQRAGHRPTGGTRQIQRARLDRVRHHPAPLGEINVGFQLPRAAMQPVGMPGGDHPRPARLQIGQHGQVVRPGLAGERGQVVIGVHPRQAQAQLSEQRALILQLAFHAQTSALSVFGDPGVHHPRQPTCLG